MTFNMIFKNLVLFAILNYTMKASPIFYLKGALIIGIYGVISLKQNNKRTRLFSNPKILLLA